MFTTRPELRGTFGMVSSTHWLASQTGMAILERGGNAIDAAVAAGLSVNSSSRTSAPGGDQQDQWSFIFYIAHAVFGLNLQEAIDAPMFHSSHFPSSFYADESHPGRLVPENRLEPETVRQLRDRGHDLVLDGSWSLGWLCVAGKDPKTGQLTAAANARGMQGYAVGR